MKLIPILLSLAAVLSGLVPVTAQQPAQSPGAIPDIGSRRELFVDDFMIERLAGKAELRLHQPTPREVVSSSTRRGKAAAVATTIFSRTGIFTACTIRACSSIP